MRAQAEALEGQMQIIPGQIHAYREGTVGWVIDRGPKFRLSDGEEITFRHTLVFHQEGGGEWKLVHEHASIGVRTEELSGENVTA